MDRTEGVYYICQFYFNCLKQCSSYSDLLGEAELVRFESGRTIFFCISIVFIVQENKSNMIELPFVHDPTYMERPYLRMVQM